ncbi:hypothetical protein Pcinc_010350 [Petrolisthes cinctipes]|uniref:Sacsin/Nov domain-containing protein n=2 Tax=Petrolisthes cinctipes TaxID=88211 RepID=A0AAE1G3I4_PETCI|nr:hypothetical protein Pcinc_010350 [Petrolisthes cinctipes]
MASIGHAVMEKNSASPNTSFTDTRLPDDPECDHRCFTRGLFQPSQYVCQRGTPVLPNTTCNSTISCYHLPPQVKSSNVEHEALINAIDLNTLQPDVKKFLAKLNIFISVRECGNIKNDCVKRVIYIIPPDLVDFPVHFPVAILKHQTTRHQQLAITLGAELVSKEKLCLLALSSRNTYSEGEMCKLASYILSDNNLMTNTSICQWLKVLRFVSDVNGVLHLPGELYDPKDDDIDALIDEDLTPSHRFHQYLPSLVKLGLKKVIDLPQHLLIRAITNVQSPSINTEEKTRKSLALLRVLEQRQDYKAVCMAVRDVAFVYGVTVKPSDYPVHLGWETKPHLLTPTSLKSYSKYKDVLGSVIQLVDCSHLPKVAKGFDWNMDPDTSNFCDHFRNMITAYQSSTRGCFEMNAEDNVHQDRKMVVSVLEKLDKYVDDIPPSELLLPVENDDDSLELVKKELCSYSDQHCDWLSSDDLEVRIVHKCIPLKLAQSLGVKQLSQHLLLGGETMMEWGQNEQLTTSLNNLLHQYRDGVAIMKELVQNADDAGATTVSFLYDERQNEGARTRLLSRQLEECQGPALWAYNDATFTEDDFKNLRKLGGGTKELQPTKIGKFGFGFCSVYNLTDVPSGSSYVIFDPHLKYLGHENKTPGLRYSFEKEKTSRILSKLHGQFKPFNEMFDCAFQDTKEYDGTLFRFPLRTPLQAERSEICKISYERTDMMQLLHMLWNVAGQILIFTQNVKEIKVFHLASNTSTPTEMKLLFESSSVPPNEPLLNKENKSPLKKVNSLFREHSGFQWNGKVYQDTTMVNINVKSFPEGKEICENKVGSESVTWITSWHSGKGRLCRKAEKWSSVNSSMSRQKWMEAKMRDGLTLHMIDHVDAYMESLQGVASIPTHPYGKLRDPRDLICPKSQVAKMYSESDERFPQDKFTQTSNRCDVLLDLGMKSKTIPAEWVKERACSLVQSVCSQCALHRSSEILYYMATQDEEKQNAIASKLKTLPFLPVIIKPLKWQYAWKGDENMSKQSKLCSSHTSHIEKTVTFTNPSDLYSSHFKELVGSTELILSLNQGKNKYKVQESVLDKLGVTVDYLPLKSVIEQLVVFSNAPLLDKIHARCHAIYEHLEKVLKCQPTSASELHNFQNKKILLTKKHGFVEPCLFALSSEHDCAPDLFSASIEGLDKYKLLMNALDITTNFLFSVVEKTILSKKETWGEEKLSDEAVSQMSKLVGELFKVSFITLDNNQVSSQSLHLPDTRGYLQPVNKLCFDDGSKLSSGNLLCVHHNFKVSKGILKWLGLVSKTQKRLEGSSHRMHFGQNEPLTTRLRNIFQDYPYDSGIMKELLQNADDSGATEIAFIIDLRHLPTDTLFD